MRDNAARITRPGDLGDGETSVYYSADDGLIHIFRVCCSDGLFLRPRPDGGFDLTLEIHHQLDENRWVMVAQAEPVCVGAYDWPKDQWVIRDVATGRVVGRDRDVYTTIGRAARHYLTAARERKRTTS